MKGMRDREREIVGSRREGKERKENICLTKKGRDWKKGKNCGAHGVSD